MPETNKLLNNGYLRTPHIFGVSSGATMEDGGATTAVSPLLSDSGDIATTTLIDDKLSNLQQNSNNLNNSAANNGPHVKLPTVVYLGADSGGGGGGGGVGGVGVSINSGTGATRTTLQRNAPSPYQSTTTPMHQHSDWLMKEPTQRRRLLILAAAFMVLGAAIGALAIYFAGSYRCHSLPTADTEVSVDSSRLDTEYG
ncbi:neprilysin-1-like, partial [Rhagoletis pomonella]|uniref:neprilysin-1-like n=1 Tax=Rhagoletis pomonella TaxID=28610 RepID=UPI0017803660